MSVNAAVAVPAAPWPPTVPAAVLAAMALRAGRSRTGSERAIRDGDGAAAILEISCNGGGCGVVESRETSCKGSACGRITSGRRRAVAWTGGGSFVKIKWKMRKPSSEPAAMPLTKVATDDMAGFGAIDRGYGSATGRKEGSTMLGSGSS